MTEQLEKLGDPGAGATARGLADTYAGGIDVTQAIDRFRTKYEVDPTTGCWLWAGATNRDGYGSFWSGRYRDADYRKGPIMVLAHRWSYVHHVGPIPEGLRVLHHCDVPACVNPTHLFLGTQADNVRDCAEKGRRKQMRPDRPVRYIKLSAEIHESIRKQYRAGGVTRKALASKYGVAKQTIDRIVRQ